MGYITKFELRMKRHKDAEPMSEEDKMALVKRANSTEEIQIIMSRDNPTKESILRDLEQISGYYVDDYIEAKWYECDNDMFELSKLYPHILFTVDGTSEDNDIWRNYYLNGKIQEEVAEIQIAPFDETKLK